MKKVLSLLLTLCLALSTCIVAFADEKTSVFFSVYQGGYLMEPTKIEVDANLSDKYAQQIGYNDTLSEPTILDALIAANVEIFGDDLTGVLECNASGWITTAFYQPGSSVTYHQNTSTPYSLNIAINNNDYIDFAFYMDPYYMDMYCSFDVREATIEVGKSITLSAVGEGYDASWNVVKAPLANADITVNDEIAGTTDSNGEITLSFDEAGTYSISTEATVNGQYVFAPYALIHVAEKADEPTVPVTPDKPQDSTVTPSVSVKNAPSKSTVEKQMAAAAAFLTKDSTGFDVSTSINFLTYLNSTKDLSSFKEAFLNDVKNNLKANSGKLIVDDKENIGAYGAVIQILNIYGLNPADFEGYNLISAFENMDISQPAENPYLYRTAIKATAMYSFKDGFADTLCKSLIDNYYVTDKGMDYYGYSCDNTANFIAALSPYYSKYKDVIDNAFTVLEAYKDADGYFYNDSFNTVNCNSTATALMAYASVGNAEKAAEIYNQLCKFEKATGEFSYDKIEPADEFSTRDALLALEYYYPLLEDKTETAVNNNQNDNKDVKKNTSKTSPSTGAETAVLALSFALAGAGMITLAAKRKEK